MSEISETKIKSMTKEQNYMSGYRDGKSDAIDRIGAEIDQKIKKRPGLNHSRSERDRNDAFLEVLDIIDKYRKEQEE